MSLLEGVIVLSVKGWKPLGVEELSGRMSDWGRWIATKSRQLYASKKKVLSPNQASLDYLLPQPADYTMAGSLLALHNSVLI